MVGLAVEVKLRFQIYTGVVWTGKGGGAVGHISCTDIHYLIAFNEWSQRKLLCFFRDLRCSVHPERQICSNNTCGSPRHYKDFIRLLVICVSLEKSVT